MKLMESLWKLLLYVKILYIVRYIKQYLKVFSVMFMLYYLIGVDFYEIRNLDFNRTNLLIQMRLHDSILNEKGTACQVPLLDPFSEDAIKDDYNLPKVKCEGTEWVECYLSNCYVIEEVLKIMQYISCIYKDIIYIDDFRYEIGKPVKRYGNETYTLNKSDHIKVSCTGLEVGAILPTRWYGHKVGFRSSDLQSHNTEQKREAFNPCKILNIMVLCFKSASRNRFIRRMPKSHKVLAEELKASFFNIHSVTGDGTTAALFPLMTGKSETELPDTRKATSKKLIDDKSFIFYVAKEYGHYNTAFFEDIEYIDTFQKRFNGFARQPADHYLRALHLVAIQDHKWLVNNKNKHCFGSIPLHKQLLDLTLQFSKLHSKYVCFTLIGQIYNDIHNLLLTVDEHVAMFLRNLKYFGALRNTLLVVLGDHGPRLGQFRATYQGKLEERLPLMAMVLPNDFKKCRPKIAAAVEANTRLITTHFDVHATILAAMGLEKHMNDFKIPGATVPRGMSLLRQIPKNRTCGEAGVLPHWCVCFNWLNVPKHDSIYRKVADALVNYVNNLTVLVRSDCAERKLTSIIWVMRQSPNEDVLRHERVRDGVTMYSGNDGALMRASKEYYQVKVELSPERAVFEGTLTYEMVGDKFGMRPGDISRVSAHGMESTCISDTHPDLLEFCYCIRKASFSYKTFKVI
ncbi:unnamed protein product [Chilo suppressalis]|uniref:Sulfatase N-terminal domain-containing protein n=1 Tax=Chilo suppressalis TaxID=168631 RepID=A0ABN8LAA2_CHISP|nr:unnamed protein product [Chilo suppressalis]